MKKSFKAIYFAGIIIQILIRLPHERQRRRRQTSEQRITRTERGLLAGVSVGMLVLPIIHSLTSWLDGANYRWSPTNQARMGRIGAGIMAASLWLFWRSHRDLGTNWSLMLEIAEQHTLVTQGVYRTIRHPMYASLWLWVIAQTLLLQNWLAGGSGLLSFLALYRLRVPHEERMMLDHFGSAYADYCAQTGRVLPRLFG